MKSEGEIEERRERRVDKDTVALCAYSASKDSFFRPLRCRFVVDVRDNARDTTHAYNARPR